MNIYQSIAAVQADVDFIGKEKRAEKQNYMYRGVDQVMNTLHPLFARHKVFAVPEVLEISKRELRETKSGGEMTYQVVKVKYTFFAEDGTSVSATVLGEAMDSGDKVSNKCMSVAYKYACFQILSIPTEETTADSDDNSEEFAAKGKGKAPKAEEGPELPTTLEGWQKCRINATNLIYFGIAERDVMEEMKALSAELGKSVAEFDREDTAKAWKILWRERRQHGKG